MDLVHLSSIPIIVLKNCHKPYKHQTYKNWHNVWSWKTFTNKQTNMQWTNKFGSWSMVLFGCNHPTWSNTINKYMPQGMPKVVPQCLHYTKNVNPPSYKSGYWPLTVNFPDGSRRSGSPPPFVRQTLHNCLLTTKKFSSRTRMTDPEDPTYGIFDNSVQLNGGNELQNVV